MPRTEETTSVLGEDELAVGTSAVGLDVPAGDFVEGYFEVQGGPVRWKAAGVDPTSSAGHLLDDANVLIWTADPSAIKFIRDAAAVADATVVATFFGYSS